MIKEDIMGKDKYTEPEIDIIKFDTDDVIKESNELPII